MIFETHYEVYGSCVEGRSHFLQVFGSSSWLTYYFVKFGFWWLLTSSYLSANTMGCIKLRLRTLHWLSEKINFSSLFTSYISWHHPMILLPPWTPLHFLLPLPTNPSLLMDITGEFTCNLQAFFNVRWMFVCLVCSLHFCRKLECKICYTTFQAEQHADKL